MGATQTPYLVSGSEAFLSSFQYWKSKTERPIPITDVQVGVENRKSNFFIDTQGTVEQLDRGKAQELIEKLGRTGAYTHDLGRYWVIRTLLQQPAILRALATRYPQVLVDESQDLGTMHKVTLEILIKAGVQVSLIGDVNQGIFAFAGADGMFLKTYADRPGVKDYKLTRNYRSLPPIIDIAKRDMFPATVEVIRRLRPKAFIVENVKGLTRATFANYFHYIQLQLEFPELPPIGDEDWSVHLKRLQEERTSGKSKGAGLTYNVVPTLVNAANYGVPQKRERVFLVGFRDDLGVEWSFPEPTHSYEALLHDQWVTGAYWARHGLSMPEVPTKLVGRVEKLRTAKTPLTTLPWRTVRDAIHDLPDPESSLTATVPNHLFQFGARVYPGHTGTRLHFLFGIRKRA